MIPALFCELTDDDGPCDEEANTLVVFDRHIWGDTESIVVCSLHAETAAGTFRRHPSGVHHIPIAVDAA